MKKSLGKPKIPIQTYNTSNSKLYGTSLTDANLIKAINSLTSHYIDFFRYSIYPPVKIKRKISGFSKWKYEEYPFVSLQDLINEQNNALARWLEYHR